MNKSEDIVFKWIRRTIKCEYVGWCGFCKEKFKTYEEMSAHVCKRKDNIVEYRSDKSL